MAHALASVAVVAVMCWVVVRMRMVEDEKLGYAGSPRRKY
jgi:hypothetical protein